MLWSNEYNRQYAFNWFITQILNDNIIESENDLNTISLFNCMNKYRLSGLYNYYDNTFDLLNCFYPNKFKEYEMNVNMNLTKEMVKDCIRNYILNTLDISIDNIKYYISFNKLIRAKDQNVIKIYRNAMNVSNLFYNFNDMIEYCFDEKIDIEEYKRCNHRNYYMCYDGKIAKSSEERELYYILKDNGLNVELCSEYNDRYRIYDRVNNIVMYPDFWVYHKGKIVIVEYYGYFNNSGTFADDIGYTDKHNSKIDYYMNRLDRDKYEYIGIYPDDLKKDNSKGLVNKFKSIGIDIVII